MKTLLLALILGGLAFGQDATQLEAQYTTCEKHHIPADKCTPNIYQQLLAKEKASAENPPDPKTIEARKVILELRSQMKDPDSLMVQHIYSHFNGPLTEKELKRIPRKMASKYHEGTSNFCFEFRSRNGYGGYAFGIAHTLWGQLWILEPDELQRFDSCSKLHPFGQLWDSEEVKP